MPWYKNEIVSNPDVPPDTANETPTGINTTTNDKSAHSIITIDENRAESNVTTVTTVEIILFWMLQ